MPKVPTAPAAEPVTEQANDFPSMTEWYEQNKTREFPVSASHTYTQERKAFYNARKGK
jgi:hypothetical protein